MKSERADDVIRDVGRRIAEIRVDAGWTQQEAAEALGMPLKNLQRIESGMNLTLRTLVRLAGGFGVATRTLLDAPKDRRRTRGRPKREASTAAPERRSKKQGSSR